MDDYRKTIAVFDQLSPRVLDISFKLGSGDNRLNLAHILSLGENLCDDPFAVIRAMDKLPAMLTFYLELKNTCEANLAKSEEDFEMWYSGESAAVLEKMIENINDMKGADGKPIPASLKKAPTVGEVRSAVMSKNRQLWEEKQGVINENKSRVASMSSIISGLKARIDLLSSSTMLLNTLINKGLADGKPKLSN